MALFLAIGSMWSQVFPEASSAESPKYYTIASYNRGGYLTNVGEGKSVEHVGLTVGSFWYFTKANDNGGFNFCNLAGGFLAADKTVSETAGVWYVLANGVNDKGVALSSANPISGNCCIDANNTNTGVGGWHPSAGDWEGTTWVFEEVADISAFFKDQAKAELDVLATESVIYPDATSAKAKIDNIQASNIEELNAAISQCVADYKNVAYAALEGAYFTINTPSRASGFMKLDGSRVVGLATASSPAAIWQFKYADGAVKVYNPYTEKYLCEPDNNNSVDVAVTNDAANAGAYQLVINSKAEKAEAKVKFTSNGKSVHMSGGAVLVRWNDGGASEWTVTKITEFSEIVSLHKAASIASLEVLAGLPSVFETEAAKTAVEGVTATDWSAFAAIDVAVGTAIPTGKFAFQATSTDNHRNLVWISANMETAKAIGATEQTENAHWTLKPASGGAFYIYNVANEVYMGTPGSNCALTAEPTAAYIVEVIDAENSVVEFKCADQTIHASNHDDDKLMNYDGNEAASRWTIVAIEEEPEVDPNDYTSSIVNADLSTADAWNVEGTKGISGGMVKVASESNFDFFQTIALPAGQYKMTAKAAYRYTGSEQDEYNAIQAGTNTHLVKLYAATASYKYEANVQNRWEGASETNYAGDGVSTVNGKYVPNSSNAVKTWFDNGMYVNELVFNVQEDGEVKIGITRVGGIAGDYTNIGAWTLTRLGDAEADPKEEEPGDEPVETLKPGDVTSLFLVNTDFEQASAQEGGVVNTAPGWTMTWELAGWIDASTRKSENPGNDASQCYNVWAGEFNYVDMCQTVVLPAGIYTVATGFYSDNAAERYVYASVGDQIVKSESPKAGSWDVVSVTFVNEEEGEVTLGVKSHGWFQVDNFTLTYLGASEAEAARSEFLALKDEFDYFSTGVYESMYVGRIGSAYNALSEKVWTLSEKEDATLEEYESCMAEMVSVMENIKTIDAYYVSTFKPLSDACYDALDNSVAKSEEAAEAFDAAVAKVSYMGTMRVATLEDLQAIVAEVEPILNEYVLNALPINGYAFNYSFFLANPSFETGDLTGWTVGASADTGVKTNTGDYTTAGIDGKYLFNTWWQGIILSQEAEGLPNGNYRLTVSLASGDGGKAATIFLLANGEQKGFTMDHKGEFEDCSIDFKVTDGKVSIATIGGNDDGSYNENGHWWYKSDNYRIYYLGDGGVSGVSLYTKETYIDEWDGEEYEYNLDWDMPRLTEIGQEFKFEVNVEAPEDADKTITWSVSNDKVLSIDETGLLKVIGSGQGYFDVKATAPNGLSASCKVYVSAFNEGDITELEFTEWWIDATEAGATYQLEVEYNEDATNVELVWTSEDESVATVDQNGLVTIVGNGSTDIIATAASGVSASITVYVEISEETGIDAIDADADSVIYDLQGRRVEKAVKGIYIVNGKKVLVK